MGSSANVLSVQVVTWNVNKRHPPKDLSELVSLQGGPDILAVGLQEVRGDSEWREALEAAILPRGLNPLGSQFIPGMCLLLYGKPERLRTTEEPSGWSLGTQGPEYGQKGGAWLAVGLQGRRLGFLTAHFTHGDDNLDRRLEDFSRLQGRAEREPEVDYNFWFGDLNFRLKDQNELTALEIADKIDKGQERELLKKDELSSAMKEGKVFNGYSESEINFKPTYKFEVGTSRYDLSRRPAWTDRVLYRASPGRDITTVYYGSIPHLNISDHKPLEAFFRIPLGAHDNT